jgi:prenylated cyclic peptide (anacyclamide/piricyclamide family)
MKMKNLKPQQAAPVQRENAATVSRDGNAIAPQWILLADGTRPKSAPFAGDDAE